MALRILWVATKTPWPPADGGRLLVWNTFEALAGAGHELTLVAPFDPARPDRGDAEKQLERLCRPHLVRAWPVPFALAAVRAFVAGLPTSITRHTLPAVGQELARCLKAQAFDLVVAEQVQALAQCVWRAQNVESDLWRATAEHAWWASPILRREVRVMATYEADAVRRTARTIALTTRDAERLGALSGAPDRINVVPVPFPSELPPADHLLPGSPAVVLFGSGGWWPNAHGVRWFLREAWPRVRESLPEAQLHVFGTSAERAIGVTHHPSPADSREAFAPGSILVVPLFVASGMRMKILEAWARGIPVVATPEAAAGLGGEEPNSLAVAANETAFASALAELAHSRDLVLRRVHEGKRRLRVVHEPAAVVRLMEVVCSAGSAPGAR
jgi:glycosyltransferase involved in cell wall biosynthesis